jgi:CheY-like chemotaxis protein
LHILVVDDDDTTTLFLQMALERAGYQVTIAGSGREALALLPQVQPALVISDVLMPNMGGLELAKAIRTDPALNSIKVVLMSSVTQPASSDVYEAFIQKPFDIDEVLAVVARLTT